MTSKPKFKAIPEALKERPQWVLWRYEERDGKKTKPPFQINGRHASHSDPATWSSFASVLTAYHGGRWDGIGFMLSPDDPFAGVDLDHCISDGGEIEEWAAEIIQRLDSYTEISPSGTGVRIFLRGRLPEGASRGGKKHGGLGPGELGAIELYSQLRYLTVTGRRLKDAPAEPEDREEAFHALYAKLFPEKPAAESMPFSDAVLELDDHELMQKAFSAANGTEIERLWRGDTGAYDHDESRADAALCTYLAFWCRGDVARIDRLFRQSGLYREKWEREDYRLSTLGLCVSGGTEGYTPSQTFSLNGSSSSNGSRTATARSEELTQGLEQAQALAAQLPERLAEDTGFAFNPSTLAALALLRALDAVAWQRARNALQKAKVSIRDIEKRLPHVKLPTLEPTETGTAAGQSLPNCPAPEIVIPDPYWVRPDSTGQRSVDDEGKLVSRAFAYAPILVTARLRDIDDGTEALRITYFRPRQGWVDKIVDRGVALEGRKLTELASEGFPVAGDNAKAVAKYLHRMEAVNDNRLPCARISSHLGWQGKNGDAGFLWGRQLITPQGSTTGAIQIDELPPDQWQEDVIHFRGTSGGDDQIADGFHALGSLSDYIRAISVIKDYPRVLLGFYVSFVPPLLQILNAPNPIVDWANRTSTGKTQTLRTASSVWGKPDERAADGAMGTWDNTRVWLERASAVLSSLPVIMDDTKRAKSPQAIADLLYTVSSGRGRGRGSIKGLARTRTWRTALLSSGETPATAFTQDGGTRARVLSIRGIPFNKDDQETRRVVDTLGLGIARNYGTAGPEFVRYLYRHQDEWPNYVAEYHKSIESYAEQAESSVAGRMAHLAATIDLAAALVHAALDLPWSYQDPLSSLWAGILDEASDAAGEIRALRDVASWAYAHRATFYGHHEIFDFNGNVTEPPGGWSGSWDKSDTWEYLAFFPHCLEKILKAQNYEPESILSAWREREWLDTDNGGNRYTRKVGLDGKRPRMIAILRHALELAEE